ncbi:MAG: ribonuclease III [Alphaproteobacteria bacterium]
MTARSLPSSPATPAATASALTALAGHTFANADLLGAALTHPSLGERTSRNQYERLEFLGDRVLALTIAEILFERFPDEDEGALSKRLVGLVRREALAGVADGIRLGDHIRISPSARAGSGKARESMLADACEALIGALFLDGGLDPARNFIRRHWGALLDANSRPPRDPKTALQEWFQGRGLQRPVYTVIDQEGPAHAPVFTVEITTESGHAQSATGSNKRAAEQTAAELLLAALEADLEAEDE